MLCITNNSIKHQSFVYTQLNDQTVLFQAIQVSISQHSLFYLTHRQDPIHCYHSGSEWTREQWQWRNTSHFPKLQQYWSLAIRWFNVISRTLVWGGALTPLQRCNLCILQLLLTGLNDVPSILNCGMNIQNLSEFRVFLCLDELPYQS